MPLEYILQSTYTVALTLATNNILLMKMNHDEIKKKKKNVTSEPTKCIQEKARGTNKIKNKRVIHSWRRWIKQ